METIEVKGDKEYEVKLTGFELVKITSLIEELPYKEANPLVKKIQEQIKQQTKDRRKAQFSELPDTKKRRSSASYLLKQEKRREKGID